MNNEWMCARIYVCVCVGVWIHTSKPIINGVFLQKLCVYVHIYIYIYMCVLYINSYYYVCVCVCGCVCATPINKHIHERKFSATQHIISNIIILYYHNDYW